MAGLDRTVLDRKERTHKERLLARYVVDSMNTHNVWALKMLFIEFLNLVCLQGVQSTCRLGWLDMGYDCSFARPILPLLMEW